MEKMYKLGGTFSIFTEKRRTVNIEVFSEWRLFFYNHLGKFPVSVVTFIFIQTTKVGILIHFSLRVFINFVHASQFLHVV